MNLLAIGNVLTIRFLDMCGNQMPNVVPNSNCKHNLNNLLFIIIQINIQITVYSGDLNNKHLNKGNICVLTTY